MKETFNAVMDLKQDLLALSDEMMKSGVMELPEVGPVALENIKKVTGTIELLRRQIVEKAQTAKQ